MNEYRWLDGDGVEMLACRNVADAFLREGEGGEIILGSESAAREILRLAEEVIELRELRAAELAAIEEALPPLPDADADRNLAENVAVAFLYERARIRRELLEAMAPYFAASDLARPRLKAKAVCNAFLLALDRICPEEGVAAVAEKSMRSLLERCLAALEVSDSGPWPPGQSPSAMRFEAAEAIRVALDHLSHQ